MPKTRILFLMSRFLDGGIDTVLVDYLQHLVHDDRYDITLAIAVGMGELEVFLQRIPPQVKVTHLLEDGGLTHWQKRKITHRLPFPIKAFDEVALAPFRRLLIRQRIKKLAARCNVVIDFDCCAYSHLKNIRTRKIAWFHFSFNVAMKQNPRRMTRIGRALEHYDKVVTICQAMQEEAEKLFPRLVGKLSVIYNAKDRDDMLTRAAEEVDDKRIKQAYILAVERLEESQKDIATLLYAYQMLRRQYGHEERLYLLGKGRSEPQLKALASQLGLTDDVVFLGFSANPYPWMLQARILVHSAKMEGLPTVLIEGLMLGKLMVATDCPTGPKEILDEGKAGLLVPVGDVTTMADAMHRLLTDETLQKNLLDGAALHRRNFTYEETEKRFEKVVRE
jgi:glycosyltransferase involved in cell wall biosynthesis